MTLEEKVSQMQNHSTAIPRLGIPEYDWWNEGLHGVARSGYATVFPQAIGLAATWDVNLMHEVATVISTEARAKYNEAIRNDIHSIYYGLTIWSPNINIFRDPRWGRGQETYGEDPYLTGKMAVAFVTGIQGGDPDTFRAIATPKHFAVHSGPESDRHRFNVQPSPFDLEDTYLPAFRASVIEGKAYSLMCAYNAVDGTPACANKALLQERLRGAWSFQGFVTSDCGAVSDFYTPIGHKYSADEAHAAASAVLAGTDTSCGTEYASLLKAVHEGLIDETGIDRAVIRLFAARFKLGLLNQEHRSSYADIALSENNSLAHRELSLKVAERSMVLLKNDAETLPLRHDVKKIAVVGPNAASLAALEGNYNAVASDPTLPIDGIKKEFGNQAQILYAQGSPYADGASLPVPRSAFWQSKNGSESGLRAEYFANERFEGPPALSRVDLQIDFDWNSASPTPQTNARSFSVRWSGFFQAPAPGTYSFDVSLAHCYPCFSYEAYSVYVDEKLAAHGTTDEGSSFHSSNNKPFEMVIGDKSRHVLRVEYSHRSKLFGAGITLNWQPPKGSLLPEAVAAARQADVIVAFVGLSPELEGEEMPLRVEGFAGGDRTRMDLPRAQEEMLKALGQLGKPLVVVAMSGSAIALNWAEAHASAILEAWYPGEAGGQAIAETLSGKNNPSGRLPITFYSSLDQLPDFLDYSMQGRTYRFLDGAPLYGFGYGLSYTQFRYRNLRFSSQSLKAGEDLNVEVEVENVGDRKGYDVVELYLKTPNAHPKYALKSFGTTLLGPHQAGRVRFQLHPRELSEVDENGMRAVNSGGYQIWVGSSQPGKNDNALTAAFTVHGVQVQAR